MASPAQYDFTGDGSTRIFPVASRIISQDYLKIEIDSVQVIDLSLYDVINNSIVFKTPPINTAVIVIRVAESVEAIAELDNLTATQVVADNILDVNTVADNVADVTTVADNILDVTTVATDIANVDIVAVNIDNVNNVGNNITHVINVSENLADLIYDDTDVLKDADTLTPVTLTNKLITESDVAGGGDMLKSTYDSDNNGVVDNAEKVNNLTVETAVPVGAVFTDTLYDDTDVLKDADIGITVQAYEDQSIIAEDNILDFTKKNFELTATIADITASGLTGTFPREGTILVHSAENVSGWGVEFKFKTEPTDLLGDEVFSYFIEDATNIWIGRVQ